VPTLAAQFTRKARIASQRANRRHTLVRQPGHESAALLARGLSSGVREPLVSCVSGERRRPRRDWISHHRTSLGLDFLPDAGSVSHLLEGTRCFCLLPLRPAHLNYDATRPKRPKQQLVRTAALLDEPPTLPRQISKTCWFGRDRAATLQRPIASAAVGDSPTEVRRSGQGRCCAAWSVLSEGVFA
jgi:hypothetical protein